MIYLGLTNDEKRERIAAYCAANAISKVVMLSPTKFDFDPGVELIRPSVDWPEIQMYRTFYPLLQEIDNSTLVIVNECMRDQDRNCLNYNCIRHYLSQTKHQIIFQWLPFIDNIQNFQILFDFDTQSRWKREAFDVDLLAECQIEVVRRAPAFRVVPVPVDAKTAAAYQAERTKLFEGIGNRDPHTIPRQLYLVGGKAKLKIVRDDAHYLGRNARLKLGSLDVYKADSYANSPYTVFEFPHSFIDFCDVMALSGQTDFDVLVADLKVDHWYMTRYSEWFERIENGYASLSA